MKVVVNTFLKLVITIIVASLALCEWLGFLCVRFVFYITGEDFQRKWPKCQDFRHERIHRRCGCVLYQARNIIVVIGADPNL
jgi:hypothetical protein